MEQSGYFKDLGLDPSGEYTPKDIKKAWRSRCNEVHPDHGGDPQEFLKVTHAYKMLTDPEYRRKEKMKKEGTKEDLTIRVQTAVSFEDAFFGRTITLSYNRGRLDENYKPIIQKKHEIVTININIPAGSISGFRHVEEGKGLRRKNEIGDAMFLFQSIPHPKFRVEGINVICEEKVPLETMLKGGEIEVQTMYGLRTVTVPPGSQPGDRRRISGCGVKKVGSHKIILQPLFPTKDELKREAWKGLDINWEKHQEDDEVLNSKDEEFIQLFTKFGGLDGRHKRR